MFDTDFFLFSKDFQTFYLIVQRFVPQSWQNGMNVPSYGWKFKFSQIKWNNLSQTPSTCALVIGNKHSMYHYLKIQITNKWVFWSFAIVLVVMYSILFKKVITILYWTIIPLNFVMRKEFCKITLQISLKTITVHFSLWKNINSKFYVKTKHWLFIEKYKNSKSFEQFRSATLTAHSSLIS